MDVSKLPVHSNSTQCVLNIGGGTSLHPDFGSPYEGKRLGIPISTSTSEPPTEFTFLYSEESDFGAYQYGEIEDGSDRHSVFYAKASNVSYELFNADTSKKKADSGVIWDLSSHKKRPKGWTSADAAGLPIILGLIRYDEIEAGEINHMIRFTAEKTHGFVSPASHLTSGKLGEIYLDRPPLGAIFRLKADYDISSFHPIVQIILRALKTHGCILADNGSDWYLSGCPDDRYNNDILAQLSRVRGSAMERVDTSNVFVSEDSYAVKPEYLYTPLRR
jgi:hypothetical protein